MWVCGCVGVIERDRDLFVFFILRCFKIIAAFNGAFVRVDDISARWQ